MGVRTYTQDVPTSLPHHSPGPHSASGAVVVDWSDFAPSVDGVQHDVEKLLNWVSTCPRPSGIRVYLPSVRYRAAMYRLQRSLMSMGCTVTCRITSIHPA